MTMREITEFSREELLAELVRRENLPRDEQLAPWCEDCAQFKPYAGSGEVPPRYNPCSRGHRMNFWVPQPWESPETFGHYRPVCEHRKSMPEHLRETGARPAGLPPEQR